MRRRTTALAAIGLVALLTTLRAMDRSPEVPAVGGMDLGSGQAEDAGAPLHEAAPEGLAAASAGSAYLADEVLVSARPGYNLAAIAADHGTTLRRAVGRSGVAPVRVAPGQDRDALLSALEADPRVRSASRAGRIQGAGGKGGSSSTAPVDYQWHLDAADLDTSGNFASWVVAVLDTGVAYETYSDASGSYVQAPSLSGSSFVAPYDFVNDDAHPNDDNQHGTHIASTIASDGEVMGGAPGATLLPVKVLNEDSLGSEADLVEALYHAVDNGAHVINMSLTFSAGYTPSSALREALEYAADAGVVLIAAGGNDATQMSLYPASSPLVIGVGASTLKNKKGGLDTTWYTNLSPGLDLVAPGGDLSQDRNKDGYADGVLAETIDPSDPTDLGYWFYAGTSQAAALTSAAVVQLLDAGLSDPEDIRVALQLGADDQYGSRSYTKGGSAGDLQVDASVAVAADAVANGAALAGDDVFVTALPYLSLTRGGEARPRVRVQAVYGDGSPVDEGTEVVGTLWGADGEETFSCDTDEDGVCTAKFDKVDLVDSDGAEVPLAWGVTVDAVLGGCDNSSSPAYAGMWVTPELVWWAEALDAAGELEDNLLAVWWQTEDDPDLGWVSEAITVADLSTGRAIAPTALLFNLAAVQEIATWDTVAVDLDGAGLTTDPLGIGPILLPRLTLDLSSFSGGGLTTDPLGFTSIRLLTFYASGLTTDPLGFRPISMFDLSLRGTGLTTDPLGIGTPFLKLSTGSLSTGSLSGTAMGELVAAGGWLAGAEYPAASLLLHTGALSVGGEPITLSTGGVTSVEY